MTRLAALGLAVIPVSIASSLWVCDQRVWAVIVAASTLVCIGVAAIGFRRSIGLFPLLMAGVLAIALFVDSTSVKTLDYGVYYDVFVTVRNKSGAPVSGLQVSLVSDVDSVRDRAVSDENGLVRLSFEEQGGGQESLLKIRFHDPPPELNVPPLFVVIKTSEGDVVSVEVNGLGRQYNDHRTTEMEVTIP